jgi:hypothetical protein
LPRSGAECAEASVTWCIAVRPPLAEQIRYSYGAAGCDDAGADSRSHHASVPSSRLRRADPSDGGLGTVRRALHEARAFLPGSDKSPARLFFGKQVPWEPS